MAKVLSVTTSRVHHGKWQEALAVHGKIKKCLNRLGGAARILTQMYGATPSTITTVVEFAGWAEFGAFSAKAESDSELQGLIASLRANPVSEIIQRSVSTELAV